VGLSSLRESWQCTLQTAFVRQPTQPRPRTESVANMRGYPVGATCCAKIGVGKTGRKLTWVWENTQANRSRCMAELEPWPCSIRVYALQRKTPCWQPDTARLTELNAARWPGGAVFQLMTKRAGCDLHVASNEIGDACLPNSNRGVQSVSGDGQTNATYRDDRHDEWRHTTLPSN